jgi:hypothetical protein
MRLIVAILIVSTAALAADFTTPQTATAGVSASIATSGSGEAELLLFGPGAAVKRTIQLGSPVELTAEELSRAGRYIVLIGGTAKSFHVKPAEAKKLSFIARPSRVPVARPDAVIGVVFTFDDHDNLVLSPAPVKFDLSVNGVSSLSRVVPTRHGVAWIRTASGSREGAAQFVASLGDEKVRRVVRQVAGEPCSLRMSAQRRGDIVELVTQPIKDCSGNTLPDGTIVTFSQAAPGRLRSTVDARIKRGVARATLPAIGGSTISVASGVVLGNEIRLSGAGGD